MAKVLQYKSGMSNGFFVVEGDSVICVDGGAQLGAEYFLDACRECGIVSENVKLIVVSHAHVDHFVNCDEMRKLTGAPILCHEASRDTLENAKLPVCYPRSKLGEYVDDFRIKMTKLHGEPVPYLPPMTPDITFTGEFDLTPYGVHGRVIETFGHSLTCTSVVLDDRQAIIGDICVDDEFTDGVPQITYFGYDPDRRKANDLLLPACDRLLDLADIFYSGHGGPFTREQFKAALAATREEDREYRAANT